MEEDRQGERERERERERESTRKLLLLVNMVRSSETNASLCDILFVA